MNLTELKNNYDKYLRLNYDSYRTISSYTNCFEKFTNSNSRVYRMSSKELKEYFVSFREIYSVSYYNQMLSSVRIIFKLLKQPQKLNGIPYKKDTPKSVSILSEEEIKNSLLLITNLKHRCIINLLYIGALRISELQNIKLSDIDSKNKEILISKSKGGVSRHIPISKRDIQELRSYFRKYRPKTYLFESIKKGKKYSTTSIRNVVKKIKTNKHVYPHLIRHSALTKLINNHNILKVQRFAGHKTPKSTQTYYHPTKEEMQEMTLSLKEAS